MTDAPTKYYLRFSKAEDFDRISDFYELNAHKNVRKRETELMRQMAEDGAIVLVEDEKGKIVGSSITYAHKSAGADGAEQVRWQELGTTRISLNGYAGIFDAMVAMQTLRAFLVEPPEGTFVAKMETAPVQGLANKLGWRRMEGAPPQELLDSKTRMVVDGHATTPENWFTCGVEALPTMAKFLDQAIDNPVLTHKKTGEKIELDFSRSNFVGLFREEIKNLAALDFGDVDHADSKQNLRRSRDKWLKDFFR